MTLSFKGAHFPQEIILMGVRWSVAYPLSSRHVEDLREERGVLSDHATLQRRVVPSSPQRAEAFHRRKHAVWVSWRVDEPYIKSKGVWRYLNRVTAQCDAEAALRVLKKAIRRHGARRTARLMAGRLMPPPSSTLRRSTAPRSSSGRSSISTTWWNKTREAERRSPVPCEGSSPSMRRRARYPALNAGTGGEKGRLKTALSRA